MPTAAELRAKFKGSCKPGKRRGKLSPKQAAKVRWKRQRRKRFISVLLGREYVRQSPLLRLLRMEELGVNMDGMTFNWFERDLPRAAKVG